MTYFDHITKVQWCLIFQIVALICVVTSKGDNWKNLNGAPLILYFWLLGYGRSWACGYITFPEPNRD